MSEEVELSPLQRLRLKLFGKVPVGYRQKQGWRAPIMHYAFRCPIHGVVVDYKHGFKNRLSCPLCLEESYKYA